MMKSRLIGVVGIMAVVCGIAGVLSAQTPASPAFEVASVKINKSGDRRSSMDLQAPDRLTMTNLTLTSLISLAYKIPPGKLPELPASMASARFDIAAKTAGKASTDEKMVMLRTLLEDRFKLKIRIETKKGRFYALVLARNDGRLGPSIHRTSAECVALMEARARFEIPPAPPPQPGEPQACASGGPGGPGTFKLAGIEMSSLALTLGARALQTVVDRTGLVGKFDLDFQASLEGFNLHPGPSAAGGGSPGGGAEQLPSIFTALQEQLGLKLEPQRGPIETFVIDHVEYPTED